MENISVRVTLPRDYQNMLLVIWIHGVKRKNVISNKFWTGFNSYSAGKMNVT